MWYIFCLKTNLWAHRSLAKILPQSVARPTTVIWSIMPPSTLDALIALASMPFSWELSWWNCLVHNNLQVGLSLPLQIDLVHQSWYKEIGPENGLLCDHDLSTFELYSNFNLRIDKYKFPTWYDCCVLEGAVGNKFCTRNSILHCWTPPVLISPPQHWFLHV